jgi:hypothetical protein
VVKLIFTNFLKTHHMLGSSRVMPSCLGGFTFKSNKCFTDVWRSPKYSRLELKWLTHKSLHPTLESSTKDMDLIKSGWGELKRLLKEYANGKEPATHERGGGVPFIRIWKN